jgi:predicted unusual protein kinase regulating ubiquinone biosynthesis (AarF/ABC1/UbiB family)
VAKKPLESIKTGALSRGFSLLKMTASVGARAIQSKIAGSGIEGKIQQARAITETLGELKGAAMKLGQLLSIQGEDFLPKEVAEVLAQLQNQAPELEFAEMERVLRQELGDRYGSTLIDVSSRPLASASIGQVHRGIFTPEKIPVAVKIQYPGVADSIDSDVLAMRRVLSLLNPIPGLERMDGVLEEIKLILRAETDYTRERQELERFRDFFSSCKTLLTPVRIPRAIEELSTRRVLTTELIRGETLQEFLSHHPSSEVRNRLGRTFLRVFFEEIFRLGSVQTDPNFANYLFEPLGSREVGLVLLDFGSTKTFSEEFRSRYERLVRTCLEEDFSAFQDAAIAIDFLRLEDTEEQAQHLFELILLSLEPFRKEGVFDWAESDLPARIRDRMPAFIRAFKFRPPPREILFLNRKIGGVYQFLARLGARFEPKDELEPYLSSKIDQNTLR